MATLVLSAVGAAIAGRVGGAFGGLIGARIDGGGGRRREGPRLGDLAVQGSSYGEPLARVYGITRVAGQVIWSTGLTETARRSGGKSSGGRTTTYSYSASFAVALSARAIRGVRRVWADGKLIRGSDGGFLTPATMRLHLGHEDQAVDPLIAAAEGAGAPAYRGLAYAVFEELALADFANRVPNLSFEIEADVGGIAIGALVEDLGAAAGVGIATVALEGAVAGFAVGRAATLRSILDTVEAVQPLSVRGGRGLRASLPGLGAATALPERDFAGGFEAAVERRGPGDALPREAVVAFLDPDRDHQPGLQRARRAGAAPAATAPRDIPASLAAGQAKQIAERLLDDAGRMRATRRVRLPWRHARIEAGDVVSVDGAAWLVAAWTMETLAVTLDLERLPGAALPQPAADPGRVVPQLDAPHGNTVLAVIDLPALEGALPTAPRLWLAAAGASTGWRRAELVASLDDGASYDTVGVAAAACPMGVAVTTLQSGPSDRWDRGAMVEVELLGEAMWLEGRSTAAVLNGANLAAIGDELLQFAEVEALGARRFKLRTLLRGRRGTESATITHAAGERFVLLEAGALTAYDPPLGAVGATARVKALSPGQALGEAAAVERVVGARALRPLSPVHLRARRLGDGAIRFSWIRRSRSGFDWIDGADAPLGEERERYRVVVTAGAATRAAESDTAAWVYGAAEQVADTGGAAADVTLSVAQLSAAVGAGEASVQRFIIPV